ncbi:MAG: methyltransferase [Oscillospiraceae bacterium]|nr:methyltransferase [Oscillospiraceae bacterium]
MEHREELWQGGPCFFYDDALFKPTTDAFVLAHFAAPRRGGCVCDLGCGTGLVGLLLLARCGTLRIVNVEVQARALALAEKTFRENGFEGRAEFFCGDLRDASLGVPCGCDYIVANPPYFPTGSGARAKDDPRRTAREETACTLEELFAAARRILRWGGGMAVVHRPERLCDLFCAMREAGIEPKRMRFVHSDAAAAPSLVLVEGKRGAKPSVRVEPPLVLCGAVLDEIYFRTR